MSADNWTVCPSCLQKAEAEKEAQHEQVRLAYGKVPVEEFDQLRAAASEPLDTAVLRTFEENWEQGLDPRTPGAFYVIYSGRCEVCGSGVKFKHEGMIEMKEPPDVPRVDPGKRHAYVGRSDRRCGVPGCNLPGRSAVHRP